MDLSPVVTAAALRERLLTIRGITTTEQVDKFLDSKYERDIYDPWLMHGMQAGTERIWRAIEKGERIVVYGDYDVDGVTSLAIAVEMLQRLGARVSPYVPHRTEDGYGLNINVLKRLRDHMDLLVTVDCGISSAAEVDWLQANGVDVIITDHHDIPDKLPDARAIIHPRHPKGNYPFGYLCGAGVAWKFAQALWRDQRSGVKDEAEKWLLDLVALGTLADAMPLVDENRAIVRFGLEVLRRTPRVGVRTLIKASRADQVNLTARDVVFELVPKLNAAGRMDHAQPALELLLTDEAEYSETLLREINQLNTKRQTVTKKIMVEAERQIDVKAGVIIAQSMEWPAGVVGLAANRLAERFGRPAIVVGVSGQELVGSARGPAGTDVLGILRKAEKYLDKLGGHKQAAGFTVAKNEWDSFMVAVQNQEVIQAQAVEQEADAVVSPWVLTSQTVRMLMDLEPFGEGNKQPQIVIPALRIVDMRTVGKSGDHAKFTFETEGMEIDGIGFGLGEVIKDFNGVECADVLGVLEENEFRGRKRLQMRILDIAPAGVVEIMHE